VESIQKVGIGNNFLGYKTTRANINLPSDPMLINREMIGDWTAAGSKDLVSVAHEKVLSIMKTHEVEKIDADLLKDMVAILNKADAAFKGQ
jgi:trimethylamine--corrinoid protein Co-methyltransferase